MSPVEAAADDETMPDGDPAQTARDVSGTATADKTTVAAADATAIAAETLPREVVATATEATNARKPWWQHAWAIFGALVGIIGAVTGVIGVLPYIFRDATDADSLAVSVQPAEAEYAPVFAVPIGADWDTFPESTDACSVEQLAWFEEVGTRLTERYIVTVANTAAEGETLSLSDFRGDGVAGGMPADIAVVCDRTGTGLSALRAARVDPATERTAVYVQSDPSLADNPLVYTLEPGESGDFALLVQSSADFVGNIVFTSAVGRDARSVVLPIDGGVVLPGLASQRLIVSGGGLACLGADDCDPLVVIDELVAAASGPND